MILTINSNSNQSKKNTKPIKPEKPIAILRDWTDGSILSNLWALSWPVVISATLNQLGPVFDAIWVGRLGPDAVAGVGVAGIIVALVNAMVMGIFMGLGAMIARSIGAGDKGSAIQAARQGIILGIALSVMMALIGVFFSRRLLGIFGLTPEVVALGAAYLSIQFVGMATMIFEWLTNGIMQASGDTMNPMRIAFIARILAIALSPCFVFGWWIFPQMGVRGPAIASVISFSLGGGIGLWLLFSGYTRLKLNFKAFHIDFKLLWRMVRIGIPSAINQMQMSLVSLVVMGFIAAYGTAAVAASTIVGRIEMLVVMPGMGFGSAAGVLVGHNLGAKKPERAEKSGWIAVVIVDACIAVFALAMVIWANQVASIFSNDPQVIHYGSTFLKIASVGYLIVGTSYILSSCLNGAGDTLVPMIAGLVSMWGAQIPLAYFLPKVGDLGVYGIRWAAVIAIWMRAITYIIYFRGGRWKHRKV